MDKKVQNILIAGGTGLIGSALSELLSKEGNNVALLTRKTNCPVRYKSYYWNPDNQEIDPLAVQENQVIINLAGAGIADKLWSNKRKKELFDSRIQSTRLLVNEIERNKTSVRKFISASAIGYYGHRPNEILTEQSSVGEGFLADLCKQWENEAAKLKGIVPIDIIRIGIVLSGEKGFVPKMRKALRTRVNVLLGSGIQKVSWIHIDDLAGMIKYSIEHSSDSGTYNAVAPESVSIQQLQKTIGRTFGLKTVDLRINSSLIKSLLGQFSEVFLNDQMVKPEAFLNKEFNYLHPDLNEALNSI